MKYNLNNFFIFNEKGNALIQVMVAAGIAAIVALGIADMLSNQNKEVKAIGEKLATKELELQLKSMLSNPDYCNCLLRNKKFDTTAGSEAIVAADQITSLKTGYSTGPLDAVPCTAIATDFVPPAGSNIPDSTMKVGSVGLTNMTLVSPTTYKADLQVNFTATVRAIKPIKTSLQFTINPTGGTGPTDRPFVGCSNTVTNVISTVVVTAATQSCGIINPDCPGGVNSTALCPAGYYVSGCGWLLSQWAPYATVSHSNAPDAAQVVGNGCDVFAGGAPGCGVCFRAQAVCIKLN